VAAAPFVVTSIDDVPPLGSPDPGEQEWRPVRHHLGIAAFGVNAWVGREDGDIVIEEHTEETYLHEELYAVVRGHAAFFLDGEEFDAPAGTLVYVAPQTKRFARARAAGTTVLAIGAQPGVAFEPSAWELRHTG
jgi:hypothetical protein